MQFNGVYNKECKSCLCGLWHLDLCMHQDSRCSRATRCFSSFTMAALFSSIRVSSTGTQKCFLLSCPSLLFLLFYHCGGCPLSPFHVGTHGWVARICQPWERSPSGTWLPIVEALECLRHPTSTLRGSC